MEYGQSHVTLLPSGLFHSHIIDWYLQVLNCFVICVCIWQELKTVQDTRSVLQRYVSESENRENRVKTDTRAVGIVIDGEVC